MFHIDPDAVYTVKDLKKLTRLDPRTIRRSFPMIQLDPPRGRVWLTTGQAILDSIRLKPIAQQADAPRQREHACRSGSSRGPRGQGSDAVRLRRLQDV